METTTVVRGVLVQQSAMVQSSVFAQGGHRGIVYLDNERVRVLPQYEKCPALYDCLLRILLVFRAFSCLTMTLNWEDLVEGVVSE